jgi:hypothetical protein
MIALGGVNVCAAGWFCTRKRAAQGKNVEKKSEVYGRGVGTRCMHGDGCLSAGSVLSGCSHRYQAPEC